MGALNSRSLEETPDFPLGMLYRRFWIDAKHQYVFDNPPPQFPLVEELVWSIPFAIIITIIRLLMERWITKYAVYYMNLSSEPLLSKSSPVCPPSIVSQLHEYLSASNKRKAKCRKSGDSTAINVFRIEEHKKKKEMIEGIARRSNVSVEVASTWLKLLIHDIKRDSKLQKFREAAWRFGFYSFIFIYGVFVMSSKPWPYDLSTLWNDWATYVFPNDLRLYYYMSLGHYIHLLAFQFRDVKRKDFWEMFFHHILTILLMFMSWCVNFTKIGGLLLILHDASDIFLELAKLFNYAKHQVLTDVIFVIFAIIFILTRLVYYPFWVIHAAIVYPFPEWDVFLGYYLFNGLLCCFVVLHVFWAAIILRMVYRFAVAGKVKKDARSDTDDDEDETTEPSDTKKSK